MGNLLLFLLAIGFAVARFFIPTHSVSPAGSYEAFAHLFVGGLIGAWLVSEKRYGMNRYSLFAIALSAVELFAFLSRGGI